MNRYLATLIYLVAVPLAAADLARPNILLLMAEDMSPRVGAFGDPVAVTPYLDALAKQGVRYTNAYTTAGVCAPSRAAHILGMHQISTGTQHMRSGTRPEGGYYSVPPAQVKAYPELLRGAGYYTFTDQKLDYQFSAVLPGSGPSTIWDAEGEASPDWRARGRGQPFFGFRNFMITHESGVFRPLGTVPESGVHLAAQLLRWWRSDSPVRQIVAPDAITVPPYYPDTATVRADLARHYNNIAHMDAEIGRILAQLKVDGLADSTIVIWTTDHGDGLPRAKRELYDSGIRVPMIIRWPEAYRPYGVAAGSLDSRLISFVDLGPTILQLAGVEVPSYMQGRDFADPDSTPRKYVYAARDRIDEVPDRQRALRDHRFKYIRSWYPEQPGGHPLAFRDNIDMMREMRALYEAGQLSPQQALWFEAPGKERLFDLQADPHELDDLSRIPAFGADLLRLRRELDAWLRRTGDWSEQSEAAMVARFKPDGERLQTPAPIITVRDGVLEIAAAAPEHSIEYSVNKGVWRLYSGPLTVTEKTTVEARAVRYGWEESQVSKYSGGTE
ncbi:MAG: sulfatase [Halieaceae bacterium]|jgi:N-sulfoglucosamine sulfohydrolase|nr:sulfatase [Halieaceae bacterium]